MAKNDDNVGLTEAAIMGPTITGKNEAITQLAQQISEIQKNQALSELTVATNPPNDGRHMSHFPSSNPIPDHALDSSIVISTQKVPTVDLTTANPYHASSSYQVPFLSQSLNAKNPQNFLPLHHNPTLNSSTTQLLHPNVVVQVNAKQSLPYTTYPRIDHFEEKGKGLRIEEGMSQSIREEIAKAIKQFHYAQNITGLNYEDLYIHPDLDLSKKFKIPKFETYRGTGDPLTHLRMYCDQLVGVEKNEALLMRLFSRSLSGEALEWLTSQEVKQWSNWSAMAKDFIERFAYNVEIIPDRYSLEKIKQRSTESYRDYAYRWRKEASKVRPPMSEKEIVEVFVRIQELEFYDSMILVIGVKFFEVVKVGEAIEDGLKTGKISHVASSTGSSGLSMRKKEDVSYIFDVPNGKKPSNDHLKKSSSFKAYPRDPQIVYQTQPSYQFPLSNYQIPLLSYPNPHYQNAPLNYPALSINCSNVESPPLNFSTPYYQNTPANHQSQKFQISIPPYQNPLNHRHVPLPPLNNHNHPRPNLEKRSPRFFTPLVESRTQLFDRLRAAGIIQTIDPKTINVNAKSYRSDHHCAYHSEGAGHTT